MRWKTAAILNQPQLVLKILEFLCFLQMGESADIGIERF